MDKAYISWNNVDASMIFRYFLFSRFTFLLFAILAANFIPLQEGYLGKQSDSYVPYLAWIWANFDGRHYLDIATVGYKNFDFAFFPLYPLVINILGRVLLISHLYLGIIISLSTFLTALFIIYKIVKLDFNNKTAFLTLSLISFFPLSFFYIAAYPDALFLLLSVSSFYFARRGNWLLAGLFGGLTTLTRLSGVALLPALFFEWYLQNRKPLSEWKKLVGQFFKTAFTTLALTLLGFLIYLLYLQIYHGDFLLFQKSMVAWRQNEFVFPPQVIFRYLKIFFLVDKNLLVYWVSMLEFVSVILYFALTFYVAKRARFSYAILMFFIFLLPTFTGTFAGMPRYILHTFPAFIGLALLLDKRKLLEIGLLITFIVLGFIFTGLFTRGYFLA